MCPTIIYSAFPQLPLHSVAQGVSEQEVSQHVSEDDGVSASNVDASNNAFAFHEDHEKNHQPESPQPDNRSSSITLDDNGSSHWYVVQVYAGFEKRISEEIMALNEGKDSVEVTDVLVPTQEEIHVRRGVKTTKERPHFPGYVLVCVPKGSMAWQKIIQISRVSSFLGGNRTPTPISKSEVEKWMSRMNIQKSKHTLENLFHVGITVRVCDGPFVDFTGMVEEVDVLRERLKVSVTIFGRATLVDLDFGQVEFEDKAYSS